MPAGARVVWEVESSIERPRCAIGIKQDENSSGSGGAQADGDARSTSRVLTMGGFRTASVAQLGRAEDRKSSCRGFDSHPTLGSPDLGSGTNVQRLAAVSGLTVSGYPAGSRRSRRRSAIAEQKRSSGTDDAL